jgi:hypothetical protein
MVFALAFFFHRAGQQHDVDEARAAAGRPAVGVGGRDVTT